MTRIIIADDHALMRTGIKATLEEEKDIKVVGEAETAAEVLELIVKTQADILLLDISMPGATGLSLLTDVKRIKNGLKVLILSMHPEDRFALRALRAGASGYVAKDTAPTVLASAIRKVASGGRYASDAVRDSLIFELEKGSTIVAPHHQLSEREFQVFMLIAQGKTIGIIAQELFLSNSTVSTYRSRILDKMDMKTNSDLIRYAFAHKLAE